MGQYDRCYFSMYAGEVFLGQKHPGGPLHQTKSGLLRRQYNWNDFGFGNRIFANPDAVEPANASWQEDQVYTGIYSRSIVSLFS